LEKFKRKIHFTREISYNAKAKSLISSGDYVIINADYVISSVDYVISSAD
jgi:hypothetical protein